MPNDTLAHPRWLDGYDLLFANQAPVIYHCHHFNLFFEQTIDDALGHKDSTRVRFQAGKQAARALLLGLTDAWALSKPGEIIAAAQQLYATMGLGTLDLSLSARGGSADGHYLHYGYSWLEKYGDRISRKEPADVYTASFAAAANEIAFQLPAGSIYGEEIECAVLGAPKCLFELTRTNAVVDDILFGPDDALAELDESFDGVDELRVEAIAADLKQFLRDLPPDERGLIHAFGVFITRNSSVYYNQIATQALTTLRTIDQSFESIGEELLREAGRQCGFNTFGGILASAEWESLFGKARSNPHEITTSCLGIARSLGFGHWTLVAFEEGKRLVLRTPATYETAFYRSTYGTADRSQAFILQGASVAIAYLAHAIDWDEDPSISPVRYAQVMAGSKEWTHRTTSCHSMGDPYTEVVVSRVES